jgi:hypothetical protein
MKKGAGPVDDFVAAVTYAARVCSEDGQTLHGYDIEVDLAENYSFAEIILTALTGSPPEVNVGRAFERVLASLAVIPPGEIPAHAGGLSRLMGANPGAVTATVCVALSERAHRIVNEHQALLTWLDRPRGDPPRQRPTEQDERTSVGWLKAGFEPASVPEILLHDPTRPAALLGALHACGLRGSEQFVMVFVLAGMLTTLPEAMSVKPLDLRSYPLHIPEFEYRKGDDD